MDAMDVEVFVAVGGDDGADGDGAGLSASFKDGTFAEEDVTIACVFDVASMDVACVLEVDLVSRFLGENIVSGGYGFGEDGDDCG